MARTPRRRRAATLARLGTSCGASSVMVGVRGARGRSDGAPARKAGVWAGIVSCRMEWELLGSAPGRGGREGRDVREAREVLEAGAADDPDADGVWAGC